MEERVGNHRPDLQHEFDERLTDIKRLFSEVAGKVKAAPAVAVAPGLTPLELARLILWARGLLETHLNPDLFANPALNILLDLYVNRAEGQSVSTSAACTASGVPTTTALRWINALAKRGMVVKHGMPSDRRFTFLELSEETAQALDGLLGVILNRLADPAAD
nr:transcriptional regulator [Sphingomonas sp. dw_22]